jgi:hypothetical protein
LFSSTSSWYLANLLAASLPPYAYCGRGGCGKSGGVLFGGVILGTRNCDTFGGAEPGWGLERTSYAGGVLTWDIIESAREVSESKDSRLSAPSGTAKALSVWVKRDGNDGTFRTGYRKSLAAKFW